MLHQLQERGPARDWFAAAASSAVTEVVLQETAGARPPEFKFRLQSYSVLELANPRRWNRDRWLTVTRNAASIATATARTAAMATRTATNRSVAADVGVHATDQKPGRAGVGLCG